MSATAHWLRGFDFPPLLIVASMLLIFALPGQLILLEMHAASAVGYFVAGQMSELVKLGLVFMNPIYFLLILTGETKAALGRLSLAAGAITGPVAYALALSGACWPPGLWAAVPPTLCTAGDVIE